MTAFLGDMCSGDEFRFGLDESNWTCWLVGCSWCWDHLSIFAEGCLFFFFFEQMVLLGAVSLTESAVSDFFFHVLRADSKRSRDLSESSFILCPYKRFIYTSQVTMSHGFSLLWYFFTFIKLINTSIRWLLWSKQLVKFAENVDSDL